MPNGDPHHMQNRLDTAISKIENSSEISQQDRELLEQFRESLVTQDLSTSRICRHLQCLRVLAEYTDKGLDITSRRQVNKLVAAINQDKIKDSNLSDSTKAEYRKSLIKFVASFLDTMQYELDVIDEKIDGEELMKNITSTVTAKRPDPDRLPTPNTVRHLVENATNNRDKAFLMTLWSTGGRIGEILGLQWKDLKFKSRSGEEIAQVKFRDTKTDDDRKVPLRAGLVYLKKWEEESMESSKPESYIFHNLDTGDQLTYNSAYKIIKRSRKRSEIDSEIKTNPHAFRKARATFLAAKGMNQANLCEYMGWVQGSDQAAVYIGLAESDKENSIMELAGLEASENEEERDLLPVTCTDCRELHGFDKEKCTNCGAVLSTSKMFEKIKIQETKEKLKTRMIEKDIGLNDDDLEDEAERILEERLG